MRLGKYLRNLFLAVVMLCGLALPCYAADGEKYMIEPFMIVPWGASVDDVIAKVGIPDKERNSSWLVYHNDFMGIPAEINYGFNHLSSTGQLRWLKLECFEDNIPLVNVMDIVNQTADFVKGQMQSPKSIRKSDVFNYIDTDSDVMDKIMIFKDYILDDETVVLLFYWWWESDGRLEVSFRFDDRRNPGFTNVAAYEQIIAGAKPNKLVFDLNSQSFVFDETVEDAETLYNIDNIKKLLTAEKEPFVNMDWELSPSKFKKLKGKPVQEENNWFYNQFIYEDTIWGVPAKTSILFSRNYNWVGFKHMRMYDTGFEVHGLDLAQAQTITKEIILSLNSLMQQPSWLEGPKIYQSSGNVTWRSIWFMYDEQSFVNARFFWHDDRSYIVNISLSDIKLNVDLIDNFKGRLQSTPLTETGPAKIRIKPDDFK